MTILSPLFFIALKVSIKQNREVQTHQKIKLNFEAVNEEDFQFSPSYTKLESFIAFIRTKKITIIIMVDLCRDLPYESTLGPA